MSAAVKGFVVTLWTSIHERGQPGCVVIHGRRVRRTVLVRPEEEARLLAALRRDRGASFSHWLVTLGLRRADELGVAEVEHVTPPEPAGPAAKKTRAKKR